jgi:hypothetical protein
LSPGGYTRKRAAFLDHKQEKKRQNYSSKSTKRRRLDLKFEKTSTTAAKEIREGDTYCTSIAFEAGIL